MKVLKHTALDNADVFKRSRLQTQKQINMSLIVAGQDVDLMILITALTPEEIDVLLCKEAQGNVLRKVDSS